MYYNNLNRQQDDDDLKFMPLNIKEPFLDKDSNWFPIVNMTSPNIGGMTNNFMLGFATPMANGNIDDNLLKTIEYTPNIKYSYTDEDGLNTYYTNNTSNNMNGRNNNLNNTLNNMSESSYNQNDLQGSIDGYMSNTMLSRNSFNSMSNVTPQNTPGNNNYNNQSNFNLNYPSETESGELYSYNKDISCNKNLKNMPPSGMGTSPGSPGMAPSGMGTSTGGAGMAPSGMGTSPGSTGMPPSGMGISPGSTGMPPSGMGTSPGSTGMPPSGMGTSPGSTGMPPRGIGISLGSIGMTPGGMVTGKGSSSGTISEISMGYGDMYNLSGDMINSNQNIDYTYNSSKYMKSYTNVNEENKQNTSDRDNIIEPPHMEVLRQLNLGDDHDSISRDVKEKEVNKIFKKIEGEHGFILGTLKIYRIPYSISSLLVKKIIKLTLENCRKDGGE
ncbi:hypothetical protein ACH36K_16535 [Clostridium sp. MB05]